MASHCQQLQPYTPPNLQNLKFMKNFKEIFHEFQTSKFVGVHVYNCSGVPGPIVVVEDSVQQCSCWRWRSRWRWRGVGHGFGIVDG